MWSRSSDLSLPSTRPTCLTISSALSKVCQAVQSWWKFIDFVLRYSSAQCYSAWPYIVRPSYSFCPSIVFARLSNSIFSCPVACALDFTFQFDWWLDRDAFCIYICSTYILTYSYIFMYLFTGRPGSTPRWAPLPCSHLSWSTPPPWLDSAAWSKWTSTCSAQYNWLYPCRPWVKSLKSSQKYLLKGHDTPYR